MRKLYYHVWPHAFDDDGRVTEDEITCLSEEAIVSIYWPGYVGRLMQMGRQKLATIFNCIEDYKTVNWAMPMTREHIKYLLSGPKPRRVRFIKKDGSERIMYCTINRDLIPSEYHTFGYSKEIEHLITVFDVEKQAWRNINLSTDVDIID